MVSNGDVHLSWYVVTDHDLFFVASYVVKKYYIIIYYI